MEDYLIILPDIFLFLYAKCISCVCILYRSAGDLHIINEEIRIIAEYRIDIPKHQQTSHRKQTVQHYACKQHLANQQDEIRRFAESRDLKEDVWVNEIVSGKKREQERRLGNLLRRMKRGDTLIVTEMSRLSRSMTDLMAIMGKCLRKGIKLYTTKEKYSFDDSINSKVLCFAFGLVAEIERNLISMRTREALALRKAEGMVLGRRAGSYTKMNILIQNRFAVIEMLGKGQSIGEICRRYDLSRDTFAKFRMKYPSVQKALAKKERQRMLRTAGSGARRPVDGPGRDE